MFDQLYYIWPALLAALLTALWKVCAPSLRKGQLKAMAPVMTLTGLDCEDSLADRIEEASVLSDFHEPTRHYLPQPRIRELITQEAIRAELDKFEVELRLKDAKTYESFRQYDQKYRSALARWIYVSAPRLFAIVVQCDIGSFRLLLAMGTFYDHGFDDKKLPVMDTSKMIEIFPPKSIWSTVKLRDFYSKQWRLLVPVFSPTKYDYDLDADCIFPFKLLKTMHKAGAFSSVYRIQINEDHRLHENMGDVRLHQL
jgi:hypothetical protein